MEKFNIFIFLIDSQKPDNLHCYGYHKETSPNIDKVAKEGVTFMNNFTCCAWTPPSHASLFTGRYYSGHQTICLGGGKTRMPEDIPTMAEALNSLGYETAAFSNNFWVNNDEGGVLRGFKDCFYPSFLRRHDRKYREIEMKLFDEMDEPERRDSGSLLTTYLVKEWLKDRIDKPFMIFINFMEVHHPYHPPEPFRSRFYPPGVDDEVAKRVPQMTGDGIWSKGFPKTPYEWLILQALLDGETAVVDNRIGLILEYLKETGIYDNTIIVITSDHGDTLWEHLKCPSHSSLYDSNIHTPLIVKGPDEYSKGEKAENITQIVDIFPTITEILKIRDSRILRSIQGTSLSSALTEEPKRTFAIAEMRNPFVGWIAECWCKAIRTMNYKYIWCSSEVIWRMAPDSPPHPQITSPHEKEELFNLQEDPLEQYNLIKCKEAPFEFSREKIAQTVKCLREKLERFLESLEIPPVRVPKEIYKKMKVWGQYQEIIPI